jgi:branched-chain amino acid transport system substrate-binding protein
LPGKPRPQHGRVFLHAGSLLSGHADGAQVERNHCGRVFCGGKNLNPARKSVAIVGADAEFGRVNAEAARGIAKQMGLEVVYDRDYPPSTLDFAIVRAVQASKPDLVFLASYPTDSVGIVRSINEIGLKARLIGGGPVGLQFAAIKTQLGPLINNMLGYELYVPASTLKFPGLDEFIAAYQAQATGQGVDPLGFYVPPFVYAAMEVLEQAIFKTGSLDQGALAATLHQGTFPTLVPLHRGFDRLNLHSQ